MTSFVIVEHKQVHHGLPLNQEGDHDMNVIRGRFRNSGWKNHDGSRMPVEGDTLVYVRQRDGWESPKARPAIQFAYEANNWFFGDKESPYDIIAYRLAHE